MTVTFWSKTRGDWITVENALSIERFQTKNNGRLTWFYLVKTCNGNRTFDGKE